MIKQNHGRLVEANCLCQAEKIFVDHHVVELELLLLHVGEVLAVKP